MRPLPPARTSVGDALRAGAPVGGAAAGDGARPPPVLADVRRRRRERSGTRPCMGDELERRRAPGPRPRVRRCTRRPVSDGRGRNRVATRSEQRAEDLSRPASVSPRPRRRRVAMKSAPTTTTASRPTAGMIGPSPPALPDRTGPRRRRRRARAREARGPREASGAVDGRGEAPGPAIGSAIRGSRLPAPFVGSKSTQPCRGIDLDPRWRSLPRTMLSPVFRSCARQETRHHTRRNPHLAQEHRHRARVVDAIPLPVAGDALDGIQPRAQGLDVVRVVERMEVKRRSVQAAKSYGVAPSLENRSCARRSSAADPGAIVPSGTSR